MKIKIKIGQWVMERFQQSVVLRNKMLFWRSMLHMTLEMLDRGKAANNGEIIERSHFSPFHHQLLFFEKASTRKKATSLKLGYIQYIYIHSSLGCGKESAPCSLTFQWSRYWSTERLQSRAFGCWSVFIMTEPLLAWLPVL